MINLEYPELYVYWINNEGATMWYYSGRPNTNPYGPSQTQDSINDDGD